MYFSGQRRPDLSPAFYTYVPEACAQSHQYEIVGFMNVDVLAQPASRHEIFTIFR